MKLIITQKNPNKEWYNNVYLCVEINCNNAVINGFKCYTFKNLDVASNFYKMNNNKMNNNNIKKIYTIIPLYKWIPFIFHKHYLDYKLKKLYWKNDITIFRSEKYI